MPIDLVKYTIGLLFQHMNLMSGVRQVGVPCGSPFDQQIGSLTDQLDLALERLEELLVAWKQIHVWRSIFPHAILSPEKPSPVGPAQRMVGSWLIGIS